jgi:hypothetical protein
MELEDFCLRVLELLHKKLIFFFFFFDFLEQFFNSDLLHLAAMNFVVVVAITRKIFLTSNKKSDVLDD